jgi:hypothetical protein
VVVSLLYACQVMSDDAVAVDITPWEIYRNSAVGISLTNALNSMLENGEISTDQALLVLDEYDRWFQLRLRDNLAVDGGLRELSMHVSVTMLVLLRRSELLLISSVGHSW